MNEQQAFPFNWYQIIDERMENANIPIRRLRPMFSVFSFIPVNAIMKRDKRIVSGLTKHRINEQSKKTVYEKYSLSAYFTK